MAGGVDNLEGVKDVEVLRVVETPINPSIRGMGHNAAYLVRMVQLQDTQPL
ncbi:hypothetical protein NW768_009493 [Fusarium equiseti]|uniref:Uncharacterized protein n=1 Tax=Fusarium equiseti TaxID=61235 RepID=A0ABQ8R2Q8_FUSEQ|nr:hypothetical protein NW768_009493 [Fusarium equiseti]